MQVRGLIKAYGFDDFVVKKTVVGKDFIVEGWASKPILDRVDDIVLPEAFKKSVDKFKQNPALFPSLRLQHEHPVGRVFDLQVSKDGLYAKAKIASGYDEADKARIMVEQKVLRFFSIGFVPKEVEYRQEDGKTIRVIKDLDLLEISLTDVPACQEAIFEYTEKGLSVKVLKGDEEMTEEKLVDSYDEKKVSGRTDFPLADRSRRWSKREAVPRLRKWASKDGSGKADQMIWSKYQQVHFWYDENRADEFTAYKLPFCDVIDGQVYAIPRAIFAVAVVLQGGRGGLNVPEADKEKIKKKVAVYYHRMGEEPPWNRKYLLPDEVFAVLDMLEEEKEIFVEEIKAYIDDRADEIKSDIFAELELKNILSDLEDLKKLVRGE